MADATEQFSRFKELIATADLPSLGPERRAGVAAERELNERLGTLFASERIDPAIQPLLRSAALLWHDHLDASHTISQGIETPDGSWLHGIMHRREPDYSNAKYWFHRVGNHESFPELAEHVQAMLSSEPKLAGRLIRAGEWQPTAFVDACEQAEQGNDSTTTLLQRIQAAEFDALVKHIFQSL
jgi:hypothetical protein